MIPAGRFNCGHPHILRQEVTAPRVAFFGADQIQAAPPLQLAAPLRAPADRHSIAK
jgi:hypothetical protein